MNLKQEFEEGVSWLDKNFMKKAKDGGVFFENNIRVLGGLLGAYSLSHDSRLLKCAERLGRRYLQYGFMRLNDGTPIPREHEGLGLNQNQGKNLGLGQMDSSSSSTSSTSESSMKSYLELEKEFSSKQLQEVRWIICFVTVTVF